MRQPKKPPVALGHDPRMQIVDAHDLAAHGHRGEIAEAQQAAFHVCRQLQLYPNLRQPRTIELRHEAGRDVGKLRSAIARYNQLEIEAAGERMTLADECVKLSSHLARIARHAGRLQGEEIAVDRPDTSCGGMLKGTRVVTIVDG
jgi:hypothetical protein